ncbi:MAG: CARDB domain-containing protein [Minicystis sp.]
MALLAMAGCARSPDSTGHEGVAEAALPVSGGPDLIVSAVTGPASVLSSGAFTAAVTVCNQGDAPAAAMTVQVRLSSDTVINTSDLLVGSATAGVLYAGQCANVNVSATAPATTAAYYLGAIADATSLVTEVSETNNTLAGSRIGVGSRPDLVVSSLSGPASAAPGVPFTAAVTVCNQGTTASASSTLSLRLSTDTTINTTDTAVGSATVAALAPGACTNLNVSCSTSITGGLYYLGAIADLSGTVVELDETNNTRVGAQMGLGSKPDLVVSAVSGPVSAAPGSAFTTAVTVCNQGTTASAASSVSVRLSTDAVINTSDYAAGTATVPTLAVGQCANVNVNGTTTSTAGLYYLGAIADVSSVVVESNEGNNTKAGATIGIGAKPDLIVSAVTGPAVVAPGAAFSAAVTVCNQGTTPTSPTNVDVRLSFDGTINAADYIAGSASVPILTPGQCANVNVNGIAGAPQASYYLGAVVDPGTTVAELDETNNTKAGSAVLVQDRPDLVVTAVSGPALAGLGAPITTQVTVCNQGTVASGGSDVEVRLSTDAVIATDDFFSGSAPVGPLSPAQCATVAVPGAAASVEGTYTLGARVDMGSAVTELSEGNNTFAGGFDRRGQPP